MSEHHSFSRNNFSNEKTTYQSKQNKHLKNLTNTDFTNPNSKLNSPRSKDALLNLGIDLKSLYFQSKEQFLSNNPHLKNETPEVKNRHYRHFEEKRKEKIQQAINKRQELISSSPQTSFPKSLSSDKFSYRDADQLNTIKKQNLCEIKNLIDFEINLSKKRFINERKISIQQERENKRNSDKEKERQDKAKEEKELEQKRNEQMKQDQIKQTKEYKQYFLNQMKEFKLEEEKILQQQKLNIKKQMEAAEKDKAFRDKLDKNYQNLQKALETKQKMMDMKNEERKRKMEHRKFITSQRLHEEQLERERKSNNAKIKKEEIIKSKYDKYLQKQENIQQIQKEHQRRKEIEMKEQQKMRKEQEMKNEETRNRNNERLEQRKQNLINRFKLSNEKIENQKRINLQNLNNKLLENQIRTIDKNEKIKQTEDQLKYKNFLKLKEIENKQKRAEDMIRRKEEMALKKMRLQEEMKIRKDGMLRQVGRLIGSGKYKEREDIYNKIFSREDMHILGVSLSPQNKTKEGFYKGLDVEKKGRGYRSMSNFYSYENNNNNNENKQAENDEEY